MEPIIINSTVEEFPIQDQDGNVIKPKFRTDDESLDRYAKVCFNLFEEYKNVANKELDVLTSEERSKLKESQKYVLSVFFNEVFGEGWYDKIYEFCGRSSHNLIIIAEAFIDRLNKKLNRSRNDKLEYYVGSKKVNKKHATNNQSKRRR